MMSSQFDIRIRQGFGPLRFGIEPEELGRIFGACDEEEVMEAGDGETAALVWHYWSSGFSFFFDIQTGRRLHCIETDNEAVTLFGQALMGLSEAALKQLFKNNGFDAPDEELHEWGEKRISFEEASLDFYFDKGRLISINISE